MKLLYVPIVYRIDVKMDWCNTEFNGTKLDPHKQYAEMVTKMPLLQFTLVPYQSAALDNTTKEFFFNSCEWGVDHHDSWDSTERIIEHNVGLSKYAGKFVT